MTTIYQKEKSRGIRFWRRGSLPCFFLNLAHSSCSICIGDSKSDAGLARKSLTDLGFWTLCIPNLLLTPDSLPPFPIYRTSLLASPSSYMPRTLETDCNLFLVNLDHLFCIGMMHLLSPIWYNKHATDLATGGLEPPRALPTEFQARSVCPLQHVAIIEGSSPARSLLLSIFSQYKPLDRRSQVFLWTNIHRHDKI